ncbi:response regulator transcription factor [Chloroflexia bacterium SDU3-3]|nr:response regulator transcription factor [Chloroflexia bacterium SDU3-3]
MSILIADDDLLTVKLTSFVLEEAGYQVIKVYNGQDALSAVREYDPELILLDVSMPKSDGFDVCRQIRITSNVPIIFLSGRSQLQDRVLGLQIGGDDYISKPFEPSELLARIEAVLRRRNHDPLSPSSKLTIGPITMDPITHEVTVGERRPTKLTPVEFRLLYYLMRHPGRVLNTTMILEKVWGNGYDNDSNLVPVYIRRLRAKIEENINHPHYIVTVTNLGYKFEA